MLFLGFHWFRRNSKVSEITASLKDNRKWSLALPTWTAQMQCYDL